MSRMSTRLVLVVTMAGMFACALAQNCSQSNYPVSLDKLTLKGKDMLAAKDITAQACLQLCCQQSNCTAWQFHVSSTDPTHNPLECWLSALSSPPVSPASPVDVWVGGSKGPVSPGYTRGGASIQSVSSWFYYKGTASDTLLRELTDQSIAVLAERSANVSMLRSKQQWNKRVKEAKQALEQVFAPLPPVQRTPPTYKVVDPSDVLMSEDSVRITARVFRDGCAVGAQQLIGHWRSAPRHSLGQWTHAGWLSLEQHERAGAA
eukprot:m.1148998 g.1148998  ORF g.1148998 m.1148998 type:complete len:262 (-) comp24476_c0_seq29:4587-5372(-)